MYFFKSVFDKKKKELRVVALEGQTYGGKPVDTSLKVSCSKSVRNAYPEGAIFYSVGLTLVGSGSSAYYKANIYSVEASSTAKSTYEAFKKTLEECKKESTEAESGTTESPKPEESIIPTFKIEIEKDSTLAAPTALEDGFYVEKDNWTMLVRNIKKHVNTMIIGPTGTGKTSVVKQLCDRLGLKLHIFDMGSMVDPISSLLGVHRLEDGKSVFDYAKFTQVIQEPCVILLDELSRAAFSTMNILFPCLDDRRKLSIEIASGKGVREIPVHPEVTFIATANVGAEYTGTNSMDRALINRFFPVELGNIPTQAESQVLQNRSGILPAHANSIVKVANTLRSLYQKQEISTSISIRETLLVASLVVDGWEIRNAMEMIYLPIFEGTKSDGERATVYKTISSY